MAVAQARAALAQLQGQMTAMHKSLNAVDAASNAMAAAQTRASRTTSTLGQRLTIAGKNAMKSASQFQWYSRQLMYNVGLPLLIVGAYAGKWALETEQAMVRVNKVYGDLRMDPKEKKDELDALAGYFEAVSNRYGILQKDVVAIGADWAAAGAQALGLAKATKLTVETMILGEMNAEEATSALIAIQEAWRLSAKDLQKTIGELNLVENETAVTMQGLIQAFTRTGSAARIAGLSTGDLAAMIAAISPAAGNATVVGNSLKTILSRLAKPTGDAAKAMNFLLESVNLTMDSKKWRTMDARKQLELLASSFSKLDKNQKQSVATDIAGRQQYNRLVQLMDALGDKTSAYFTAQDALRVGKEKLNGETRRQIQYESELNQVLQSNPQQIKIVLAQLQNMAIKGIAPLIPYFIAFLAYMKQIFQFLGAMPPEVKNLIAAFVLFSLAISLLSKLASPFILIFAMLARLAPVVVKIGSLVFTALANPWVLAIGAIVAAVAILINWFPDIWNKIVDGVVSIWSGFIAYMADTTNVFGKIVAAIIRAWYALPESVRKAIQAVVDIVYQGAMAVYSLFSYLNPFAKHSPSLVENVTRGMAVIVKAFSEIVDIETPINKAYAHLKQFKDLMASFRTGKAIDLEFADKLKAIKAINPAALASARAMIADIKVLQKLLDKLGEEMAAQQKIVDAWKKKLDAANAALDEQQNILDSLGETVDYYQGLINDAQADVDRYASTALIGMQELEDEVQANTEAQNLLKLAMAQMEQTGSAGFDSLASRMAALNGEFETLTAKRDELVKAGAGSDILQYYDQQIAAIEAQKNSIEDSADAYTKMGQELSDLEKQANILDLERAVNFDPLTYQIEKLANAQEELSYEEIVNGITNAKKAIVDYTPELEEATKAYEEQEAVVKSLKQARDEIQRQYDIEDAKLQKIKDRYDAVKGAIDALKDAINEMSKAADSANKKLGKGGLGGAGGGYPGGGSKIDTPSVGIAGMEKGTAEDIRKAMEELQSIADGLDFTKPIREAWEGAVGWWTKNIQPGLDAVRGILISWFTKLGIQVGEWLKPIGEVVGNIFGDDFQVAWTELVSGIQGFIDNVAPGFESFWREVGPFISQAAGFLWEVIKAVGVVVGAIIKIVVSLWNGVINPLLTALGNVFGALFSALGGLFKVIGAFLFEEDWQKRIQLIGEGLLQFVTGIIDAGWNLVKGIAAVILGLLGGLFEGIWDVFAGFFPDLAKGISDWFASLMDIPWIKGFVEWVGGAFQWLYDFLLGHSVIPDIVNGITGWFTDLVGWVAAPITAVVNGISGAFTWVWDAISNTDLGEAAQTAVSGIQGVFSGVWDWVTGPFKKSETDVKTSMNNIETTASSGATDINNVFNSSTWQGLGSGISDPFSTGADDASDSFDDIFDGFKGLGKDLSKTTRSTDWTKFNKSMKKYWDKLPKDQKTSTKKIVSNFTEMASEIQKTNPKLWDKIVKTITKSTGTAADDVALDARDIKNSITGLGSVQVPANWRNLDAGLSAPTGTALRNTKGNVKDMQDAIKNMKGSVSSSWKGLDTGLSAPTGTALKNTKGNVKDMQDAIKGMKGSVSKDWKDLSSDLVDPVKDAASAIKKIKFSSGNITSPLNKIKTAADRVTSALSKMISKWNQAERNLGLKYGGSVAEDKLNRQAGAMSGIDTRATGGAIHGPGGPTSDRILSWLSSGEHVWTAREVAKLGGQGSVYALRAFIRRNDVNAADLIKAYRDSVPGHASGGAILAIASSTSAALKASTRRSQSASVSRAPVENRTTNIEHAHFEFPNIKSPSDAKEFLDNLEALL